MHLVINKRRSPTGDAAAPHRRPRASRSGADQAHTLSLTNRPLNRLLSLCKITNAGKHVCTTKSAAGSGAVPADPLGIGCRFSPPRARFSLYVCVIFVISIRFKPMLCSSFCFVIFVSFHRFCARQNTRRHRTEFLSVPIYLKIVKEDILLVLAFAQPADNILIVYTRSAARNKTVSALPRFRPMPRRSAPAPPFPASRR